MALKLSEGQVKPMSHFVPNTGILPRPCGSLSELSETKERGAQPKHHFRNPMLYPFELRARVVAQGKPIEWRFTLAVYDSNIANSDGFLHDRERLRFRWIKPFSLLPGKGSSPEIVYLAA